MIAIFLILGISVIVALIGVVIQSMRAKDDCSSCYGRGYQVRVQECEMCGGTGKERKK